jgi:hypothetical protein
VTLLASASVASQVYPGLVGFLVVAGMGLALYFLFRSLNKQLHKISTGPRAIPPDKSRPPRPGLASYRAMQAETARTAQSDTGAGPGSTDQPGSSRP